MAPGGKLRFSLLVIILVVFLDQVTKAKFATSCNSGIAFSIFTSFGFWNIIAPVVILLGCFYFLLKREEKMIIFPLLLVIGGGVSNVLDRLVFGCVRDFVDLKFWPSFNLADSAVTIGILVIVFGVLVGKKTWKN